MFDLGKNPLMRFDSPLRILRNSASLSVIVCGFGSPSWAAPSPKPVASVAPAAPAPAAKPVAKPDPKATVPAGRPAAVAAAAAKPAAAAAAKPAAAAAAKPAAAAPPAAAAAAKPAAAKPAAAAPPVVAKPRPKPVAVAVAAPAARPAPPVNEEVAGLRLEVKALREDLNRAVGAPAAGPGAARQRLTSELVKERKKLAAIQAAVEGGLERTAVADSITRAEAGIAELEESLTKLPAVEVPATHSLYEISAEVDRLNAAKAASGAPAEPQAANLVAASTPPKPLIDVKPTEGGDLTEKMSHLSQELTNVGDALYRFERPANDDFHVGAVELDASLKLTPFVSVSTAVVFDGAEDAFGLGAFVIDCGIEGEGDGDVVQSSRVSKSGVSFGRFDVPFGIAYLQYPSVENRLLTVPQAVDLTHGGWNDIGAQGYAAGGHWTTVAYVVNGPEHPISAEEAAPSRTAGGARLSAKLDELIEVGGSGHGFCSRRPSDGVRGRRPGDDARSARFTRRVPAASRQGARRRGAHARRVCTSPLKVDPAFLVARYDTALEGSEALDRRGTGGASLEIFPQGEARAVYEQSLDSDIRMMTLQLVGGSSFQPTGLRR